MFKFCLFLLLLILSSCSTSFESPNCGVNISTTATDLLIKNQLTEKIYYFVVEQKILAAINWVPSTSRPSIGQGKSVSIPFSEILNGIKTEPVKPGDKVVVHWWTGVLQDFNDVYSEVIVI